MIHIISTSISPLQPNIVPPSRLCFPSACLLVILVGPVVSFCPPCPCYPLCYCYPLMLSPCINQQSFGSSISVLTSYLDQESFPHSTSYPFFSCCTFVRHVGTAVVSVTNMMPDHSNTCQRFIVYPFILGCRSFNTCYFPGQAATPHYQGIPIVSVNVGGIRQIIQE